jgi:hypothetical protein
MSWLPAPIDDDSGGSLSSRQLAVAQRAQASAELEVFRYGLGASARAQIDQLDSQAIADASRAALDEECDLFDYGLARAGQSAAKAVLVARHVERLATINDRRITRRFGG